MVSDNDNNRDKFAQVAQEIALGTPVSSIHIPGVNVELFTSGLKIKRGDEELMIDTNAGVLGSGGKTAPLRTTNSTGEFNQFKLLTSSIFAFGRSNENEDSSLSVSTSTRGTLIRYGHGLDNAVLVSNLEDGHYGVAHYKSGVLSAGDIKIGTSPSVARVLDRDFSPLIPTNV